MDMREFDRVLLLANPTSGGGRAGRWLGRVAAAFRQAGCCVEPMLTGGAGDARRAARQCDARRPLLIAFGGDGTVNEVLNGADLERATLAVLPAGTGNVLAHELGMAPHPPEAVGQLLRGRVLRLDVGTCNGRRFACMVGAGIDGHIVKAVHERRSRWMSMLHYVPHVLGAALRPTRWGVAVELDGLTLAEGMDQVVLGNTHSYGGPIEMTPAASPVDGRLDLMCFRQQGLSGAAFMVPFGLLGAVHRCPRVLYRRGRRAVLTSERDDVPYQVDGEPAGFLPVEVELHREAVPVLAPAGYRPMSRGLPANA